MEPVNGDGRRSARFLIPVPGMKVGQSVSLGSVLKRMTSVVGIRTCGGCEGMAAKLNRMVEFGKREGCCG